MNMDLEQPADILLVGGGSEVQNYPLVDNGIEADVRDALHTGRDIGKRIRSGLKRVRNRFQITLVDCTNGDVGARG